MPRAALTLTDPHPNLEEGCRHRQLRLPCDIEADARDKVEGLAHLRLVRGDELLALLKVAHDLHEV